MRQSRAVIFCYMCKRFKCDKSINKEANLKAVIRSRLENELLFGKVLESSKAKEERLEKLKSNNEQEKLSSKEVTELKNIELAIPPGTRSELKKEDSRQRRTNHNESSKSVLVESDTSPNILGSDSTNPIVEEKNQNSLFSFPLLNLKKDKYVVSGNSEEKCIGKLLSYHPGYKSVSEILSKSMSVQSEANLERWKTNMISKLGEEEFKSLNKNQMLLGSIFRTKILNYLSGMPENELKINDELKNYWSSAKAVFPVFKDIVDSGGLVAHRDLKYKGIFDCLAVFRNEVMLVSWKKSDKYVPSLERTFDIPLQIAAYMGALNFDDRYPFRVEQALLVMAYNDGSKADLFYLDKEKCVFYWQQWLQRLDTYLIRARKKDPRENEKKTMSEEETTSEKINIDNELDKICVENQFSPRIIKEPKENKKEMDSPFLLCPLINSEKLEYDYTLKCRIEPSAEYENNAYPSVSSVLSATKSEAAKYVLERWRRMMIEKLGQEGFEKYEKETLEAGSTLHEYVRIRFSEGLNKKTEIPKNIEGFWQSLSSVFPLISKVKVTESKVAHPLCKYRGIIDCIGFFQDKLVLIDWKTSEKIKTCVSKTYDAPLQIAAYIGAVNFDPSYPFQIEEGLIVVVYSDGMKANVLHLNKEKCLKYWKVWLERLNRYQTMAYENGTKIQY